MAEYHEDGLSNQAKDYHRALKSLQEEIEAVDWYNQRMESTEDASLRDILKHNRDEEMEHAAMVLEWLRRHMEGWDQNLREYLFSEAPITAIEEEKEQALRGFSKDLGIGDLRVRKTQNGGPNGHPQA